MKMIPVLMSGAVLLLGLLLSSNVGFSKPEYTKKEKKACTSCHVGMGKKELNDTGKCYGEKKDLKACSK
ncbi:MAG: hypothetical protein JNK87_13395 [Bryobacterales bacterium]|nr:hypothetical protein [Bryobacterales bacterium]